MFRFAFFVFLIGAEFFVSSLSDIALSKITQQELDKEKLKELDASFVDIEGNKEYRMTVSDLDNNLEDVREKGDRNDDEEENNAIESVDSLNNDNIDDKTDDRVLSLWNEEDIIDNIPRLIKSESVAVKRKVMKAKSLWPDGIIPWQFNKVKGKFRHESSKNLIRDILKNWEDVTCLKFPLYESIEAKQLGVKHDHVLEFRAGDGCSSYVGFIKKKVSPMYLNENGCMQYGIIMHEIGHVIGFLHEHMRTDRDNYIEVEEENVKKDYLANFYISGNSDNLAKYDLSSDMHYGPVFFSKNGHQTIKVKDPHLRFLIGRRGELSFYDIKAANKAYKCSEHCGIEEDKCINDGFIDKSCKCYCPDALSGENCQLVDKSKTTECAEIIELADGEIKDITSPGYPGSYGNSVCMWLLNSAKGTKMTITLKINELPHSKYHGCYHWVEVRYNLLGQTGPRFCGRANQPEVMVSSSSSILLIFNASTPDKSGRGFHARVHAEVPLNLEGDAFHCTFEGNAWGRCPLKQSKDDDFDWRVHKNKTPSKNTGPDGGANNTKYYIYTEASRPRRYMDKAIIESDLLEAGMSCIQFYYCRFGRIMGSLKIEAELEDGTKRNLFYKNNEDGQGEYWILQKITFASTQRFKLIITGVIGRHYLSDTALDEFKFDRFPCQKPLEKIILPGYTACFNKPCHHNGKCTALSLEKYECMCQSVYRGNRCEIKDEIIHGIVKCAFDKRKEEDIKDYCIFAKSGRRGLSWFHTKGFFSSDTEPRQKIQGLKYFLGVKNIKNNEILKYFDLSNTANLTSIPIAAGSRCLTFHYILPNSEDHLRILFLASDSSDQTIAETYEAKEKGTFDWKSVKLSIGSTYKYTLRINVELSSGSFFALDMLKMETALCSSPETVINLDPLKGVEKFTCTFNNGGCGFYRKKGTELKWLIRERSFVFGPLKHHGSEAGYFVSPSIFFKNAGQKATLFSPTLKLWGNGCVRFYLYFWGKNIGTLNVLLTSPVKRLSVFSRTNIQYKEWVQESIPVVWEGTFEIEFEFVLQNWFGSVAIDDVTLDIKDCHRDES